MTGEDKATDYEIEVIDHVFDGYSLPSPPNTLYIALHTGDPTNDGDENEVSASDYERIPVSESDFTTSGSNPRRATNDVDIVSEEAESNWGTIDHISIWDSSDGGRCFYVGETEEAQTIPAGDEFYIPEGLLDISED